VGMKIHSEGTWPRQRVQRWGVPVCVCVNTYIERVCVRVYIYRNGERVCVYIHPGGSYARHCLQR